MMAGIMSLNHQGRCSIQDFSCVMKVGLITKQLEYFTVMSLQKQELWDANGISKMMLQELLSA